MFIKRDIITPIEFDKLKIVDYTEGQDNSSSFAEIIVPVGVNHKLSWSNRSDKYYYIVQGDVMFTVNGESNNLSSGDVCIIAKGKGFSYTNAGPTDAKLILVHTPSFKSLMGASTTKRNYWVHVCEIYVSSGSLGIAFMGGKEVEKAIKSGSLKGKLKKDNGSPSLHIAEGQKKLQEFIFQKDKEQYPEMKYLPKLKLSNQSFKLME